MNQVFMKMNHLIRIIIFSFSLMATTVSISQFRVIGYVLCSEYSVPDFGKVQFDKITHLNIAFVNPDSSGNLIIPLAFDSLVNIAHKHKIKVLVSIGGGGRVNPYYADLLKEANRKSFVNKLVQLATYHKLEGIDVDLEGDVIDENYEAFILELSNQLKPAGKLLTAALATWNEEKITATALNKFDFINIMSYDYTGPWQPKNPGPHAPYEKAVEELNFWTNTRGLSKKKINLGLPFYGYGFGTKATPYTSFSDIIFRFPDAEKVDLIIPDDGGIVHYNGLNTIQRKTVLALKNAGGVMIWELTQDVEGEKSLLNGIEKTIREKEK